MRQYDLENGMLMWCERYEEQELSEYHIFRDYFLFIEADAETAKQITEKVLDSIDHEIESTQDTDDGLTMVRVTVEAEEYGYDANDADDRVKRMVDGILRDSEEVEDYDSDYVEAA